MKTSKKARDCTPHAVGPTKSQSGTALAFERVAWNQAAGEHPLALSLSDEKACVKSDGLFRGFLYPAAGALINESRIIAFRSFQHDQD
jgi:hypothetical protein